MKTLAIYNHYKYQSKSLILLMLFCVSRIFAAKEKLNGI